MRVGLCELLRQFSAGGFDCRQVDRNGISNLFALWGSKGASCALGFNGHTDLVPIGDCAALGA
jgi:succinyl-diaminopimelate desuccinylase